MDHLLGLIVMDMTVVLFTKRFFKGYGLETEYGFATYWNRLTAWNDTHQPTAHGGTHTSTIRMVTGTFLVV